MELAASSPGSFYDERYRAGYQRDLLESGYDACVLAAVRWALARSGLDRRERVAVLDLGCGQGRYIPVLGEALPDAALHGADVSAVALELAAKRVGDAVLLEVDGQRVPAADESFDLIVLVDVIEHVRDAELTAAELRRLLKPGGVVVLTTPCANRGSIAWAYNAVSDGFERTPDGTGRFSTDEPAHLRRLRSADAHGLLERAGLRVRLTRFWGHLVTPVADRVTVLPLRARHRLAMLDWHLFRRLPNAGAMVLVAQRPLEGEVPR